jgi:hypothetical protein
MPIWLELMVLLLIAYALGMGFGWAIWGRNPATGKDRSE